VANKCAWCDQVVQGEDLIAVFGFEGGNAYCSSDCLFHQLLSDRTDEDTFVKVQEIINLPRPE